jgi:glycosyltransferase involved in cell wall biosynthesis
MKRAPLLSVFIPAYNCERYVREAIESVLDNGFSDIEVVVVDDGSSDDTARVVESIRHPALKLFRNSANLGVGATRQRGVALIQGYYLAFLDADDIAIPGRFQAQIDRLETIGGPDIVGGDVENFGDFEGVKPLYLTDSQIRAALLFNPPIVQGAVCMKAAALREGLIRYSPDLGIAEDYALWVDAMLVGLRMENIDRTVIRYRRHSASMTYTRIDQMLVRGCQIRKRVADAYFPAFLEAERIALVNAISGGVESIDLWRDEILALSHAAMSAQDIPGIDSTLMVSLLSQRAIRSIKSAIKFGGGDVICDALEMMTEENPYFEQWRAADNGTLDTCIMALFG